MNVASLELSKQLRELSGWFDTEKAYYNRDGETGLYYYEDFKVGQERYEFHRLYLEAPAYDLGYLLRKLPPTLHELSKDEGDGLWLSLSPSNEAEYWTAAYGGDSPENQVEEEGKTPEDALCALAIELFKSGILKKGEK